MRASGDKFSYFQLLAAEVSKPEAGESNGPIYSSGGEPDSRPTIEGRSYRPCVTVEWNGLRLFKMAGATLATGAGRAVMIDLRSFQGIYLCRQFVDFRKSIDGLSAHVEEMGLNPFGKYLFIFCSRRRSRLKILYWDSTGYALWYKRLEKERFPWPKSDAQDVIEIDSEKFRWLLQGVNVWKIRPHEILEFKKAS